MAGWGLRMIFALTFVVWTAVLATAWWGPRRIAMASFAAAFVLTLALFAHHITDPLKLSF